MKNKDWWFVLGAMLILAGVILQISGAYVAPYIYSVGAFLLFIFRFLFSVKSEDFRVRRLMRIQLVSSALLLVGAYFMFKKENTWALSLFIAAFLDLYVIYRMPKENKK